MSEKTAEELAAEAAAEAAKEKKTKITFDADQTAFVNSLYEKAFGQGAAKAQKEYEDKLAAEKAERERIAAEKAELEAKLAAAGSAKKEDEQKPGEIKLEEHPLFKQLQARFEEMVTVTQTIKQERDQLKDQTEKDRAERRKTRKKDQFLQALPKAEIDFYDPLEAYELAEKEGLEYDDVNDRVFLKNPATGVAKLNLETGQPMDAVDIVKDFATRKKYLVKAKSAGGLGSAETEKLPSGERAPAKDWSKATKAEIEAERQRILSLPRS